MSQNVMGLIDYNSKIFNYTTAYPLKDSLEFTQVQSEFLYDSEKYFRISLLTGHNSDNYYWKLISVVDSSILQIIQKVVINTIN